MPWGLNSGAMRDERARRARVVLVYQHITGILGARALGGRVREEFVPGPPGPFGTASWPPLAPQEALQDGFKVVQDGPRRSNDGKKPSKSNPRRPKTFPRRRREPILTHLRFKVEAFWHENGIPKGLYLTIASRIKTVIFVIPEGLSTCSI